MPYRHLVTGKEKAVLQEFTVTWQKFKSIAFHFQTKMF